MRFSPRAENSLPGAKIPTLFSVPVSEAAVQMCSRKKSFL